MPFPSLSNMPMNAPALMPARLLLIEDDPLLGERVQHHLAGQGHLVTLCRRGDEGLDAARGGGFDLVLLDILLPGLDGLSLLAALREQDGVPVMLLSALGDEQDRIAGLSSGADDYLPKPFSLAELSVRVDAILRRVRLERRRWHVPPEGQQASTRYGGLALNHDNETAEYDGCPLALTETEFRLLDALCQHRGQVLSKPYLYQAILHRSFGRHDRALDLHVSHLRRKLRAAGGSAQLLRTVWGQGYMLASELL
ncbi:DNA-binding response regulator [Alcanivorax sp. S71-1-4]|jgi:two-component system, OmpR family, response regulator PfeR|nr:DNA-binding response regulator [Alcanivorax sp. S71-1-4]